MYENNIEVQTVTEVQILIENNQDVTGQDIQEDFFDNSMGQDG